MFYPPRPLIRFQKPILVVTLLHTFFPPASCRVFEIIRINIQLENIQSLAREISNKDIYKVGSI